MFEIVFVIILLVLAGVFFLRRGGFEPPQTLPSDARTYENFEAASSLFASRAELAFFHALDRKLPSGYYLHSKVRLEDIIQVKRSLPPEARWKLRGRVKSRHVDFLITNAEGHMIAAIELDGPQHKRPESRNADILKDGLFDYVGIRLYRVLTGDNFASKASAIVGAIKT